MQALMTASRAELTVKDLRAYLEQARSGDAPRALPASRSAVDLHRNEIAERLREAGLAVSVGVGHSSFEIDLVLAAPGAGQPGRGAQPGRSRVAVLMDLRKVSSAAQKASVAPSIAGKDGLGSTSSSRWRG